MNIATIKMPEKEAKRAFRDYRDAVKSRHDAEDAAILAGYRHLAAGRELIDLLPVMRAAGVDEQNRPRLAICRADAKWCWYECNPEPTFVLNENDFGRYRASGRITFPRGFFPPCMDRTNRRRRCRAIVPIIPPQLRPAHALSNYHILWEAEWQNVPIDPLLLKHLGGTLYAVLAGWDLTPLEQAVLAGRLVQN
jgi:hypothetical protein